MQREVLTDHQRRRLLGDDDNPGLLDEYKLVAIEPQGGGKPLIAWHCPRQHGRAGTGHIGVIARDLDGDQSGLTVGEVLAAVLDHEAEGHAADFAVLPPERSGAE